MNRAERGQFPAKRPRVHLSTRVLEHLPGFVRKGGPAFVCYYYEANRKGPDSLRADSETCDAESYDCADCRRVMVSRPLLWNAVRARAAELRAARGEDSGGSLGD